MSIYKDIILAEDGALQFDGGDLLIDFSDTQNIDHIIRPEPGAYTKDPTLGFGVDRLINAPLEPQKTRQQIKTELQADEMRVKSLTVTLDDIKIDAERIR